MKFVGNTCDKELGDEMKSAYETYSKSSLQNLQKSRLFREIYVKYLEKNSIQVQFVAILLSFLYQFSVKLKACDAHSIHL